MRSEAERSSIVRASMRARWCVAGCAIALTAFVPAFAETPQPGHMLFTMDYSSGAADAAGWPTAIPEGPAFTRDRLAGAGPEGTDCYQIAQAHVAAGSSFGGDFYYGWTGNPVPSLVADKPVIPVAYGDSRYLRFRLRYSQTTDMAGRDQGNGSDGAPIRNKLIIFGDNSERPNSRFILQLDGDPSQGYFYGLQKDGGVDAVGTRRYRLPVSSKFQAVQLELRYSSAKDKKDGAYKIWVDTNAYAKPTAQRTGIVLNLPDSKRVRMGYMNNGLGRRGVHAFCIADFQIGTAFAAAWSR